MDIFFTLFSFCFFIFSLYFSFYVIKNNMKRKKEEQKNKREHDLFIEDFIKKQNLREKEHNEEMKKFLSEQSDFYHEQLMKLRILVGYIVNDALELSHDKIKLQRDNWRKSCEETLNIVLDAYYNRLKYQSKQLKNEDKNGR